MRNVHSALENSGEIIFKLLKTHLCHAQNQWQLKAGRRAGNGDYDDAKPAAGFALSHLIPPSVICIKTPVRFKTSKVIKCLGQDYPVFLMQQGRVKTKFFSSMALKTLTQLPMCRDHHHCHHFEQKCHFVSPVSMPGGRQILCCKL